MNANLNADGDVSLLEAEFSLDDTLDDVADLPEYINGPSGHYICQIPFMKREDYEKDGEKKQRIRLVYQIAQVLEVFDDEPEPKVGNMFSETFSANKTGKEYFKKRMSQLLPSLDGVSLGQMIDYITKTYTTEACASVAMLSVTKNGYTNINIKTLEPCEFVPIGGTAA
jgi:hypothetical protein